MSQNIDLEKLKAAISYYRIQETADWIMVPQLDLVLKAAEEYDGVDWKQRAKENWELAQTFASQRDALTTLNAELQATINGLITGQENLRAANAELKTANDALRDVVMIAIKVKEDCTCSAGQYLHNALTKAKELKLI